MSRKTSRRKAFFERGAQAWRRISGDERHIYVCPLCVRGLRADALAARLLSIEHVPPRSVGGKPLTLTCKECNSRAGHTVDAASDAHEHLVALAEAMSPTGARVTGTGKLRLKDLPPVNIRYSAERGNVEFNVLRPGNNPNAFATHFAAVNDAINSGTTGDFKHFFTPDARFRGRRVLV